MSLLCNRNFVPITQKRSAGMRTAAYNADVASDRRRRKNVPRHILYILTGMEYSMVKNKKVQQLTPEELRIWDMLKKKNIPIINVDERWLRLFPDNEKTPAIKRLEKELKELLKRQGKVNTELKDIRIVREQLTQSVLNSAEDMSIPEAKRLKKQAASQRLIIESREKLEQLEKEQKELPGLIQDANNALIFESVRVCYDKIDKNKSDIDRLTQWIDETRIKLKERILIKQDKETKNQEIYTYLHAMLGAKVMEALDENSD